MKRIVVLTLFLLLLIPITASAQIDYPVVVLPSGDSLYVTCGQNLSAQIVDAKTYRLTCGETAPTTPTPGASGTTTPTPDATVLPQPSATPTPHLMADMTWHSPGAHGDRPYHEHGDAPPKWVTDAGYKVEFGHVAGTPNENHFYYKHTAFKGWAGRFSGVDWYGVFHMDFNPGGHQSRFHSYQLWLRDSTSAVSHMHGWVDFGEGTQTGPNLRIVCGTDDQTRPIIMANKQGCPVVFENWYANASLPGPDLGWNLNPNYFAGGDPTDPSTWVPTGGIRNLTRRFEFAWYGVWGDERMTGEFWTTQFGNIVDGPSDPVCNTKVTIGERQYTLVCIKQTVQPTLPNVQFPGNAVQRTFPGGNLIRLPN